jgi:hypothetical protein
MKRILLWKRPLFAVGVLSALASSNVACSPEAGNGTPMLVDSFPVSAAFAASGAMGDGSSAYYCDGDPLQDVEQLFRTYPNPGEDDACSDFLPRVPGAQGLCYRFEYRTNGEYNWAGVFWQSPANNWGQEPGQLVKPGTFARVRFKAAIFTQDELTGAMVPGFALLEYWSGGIGHLVSQGGDDENMIGGGACPAGVDEAVCAQDQALLAFADPYKSSAARRPVNTAAQLQSSGGLLSEALWLDFQITLPPLTNLPDRTDANRNKTPACGQPYERVLGEVGWAFGQEMGAKHSSSAPIFQFIYYLRWEAEPQAVYKAADGYNYEGE